jgi:hypothetical protein
LFTCHEWELLKINFVFINVVFKKCQSNLSRRHAARSYRIDPLTG